MGFSSAINNVLSFTSQISNKSEPRGFSVNMKLSLHLQACPVLPTLTGFLCLQATQSDAT